MIKSSVVISRAFFVLFTMKNQLLNYNSQSQIGTDSFSSYDLGACAALVSLGYELISLNKSNPKKVLFIFRNQDGIDEAVNSYWSDKLDVNAQTMFNAIKTLKNRIYSD